MKHTFHMTFGQRYAREVHPTLGTIAHPEWPIEIRAESRAEAAMIAASLTSPGPGYAAQYAFLYDGAVAESPSTHLYDGVAASAEIGPDGRVALTAYRTLYYPLVAR